MRLNVDKVTSLPIHLPRTGLSTLFSFSSPFGIIPSNTNLFQIETPSAVIFSSR